MVNVPRTPPKYGGWTSSEIVGRRRALAIHEAGHAVAAYTLGWRVRLVTIRPIAGGLGAVQYSGDVLHVTQRSRITVALAGMEAETRLLTAEGFVPVPGATPDGYYDSDDERSAERAFAHVLREERTRQGVMRLSERSERDVRAQCWRSARELLADPQRWRLVERVAAALLKCEELGPQGFARLMMG